MHQTAIKRVGRLAKQRQMPECTYCEQTFADDEAYLAHLAEDHYDELGRIDTHRVDAFGADTKSRRIPPRLLIVIVIVNILLLAGIVFALTSVGEGRITGAASSTPQELEPHTFGSVLFGFVSVTREWSRLSVWVLYNPSFHATARSYLTYPPDDFTQRCSDYQSWRSQGGDYGMIEY